MTPELLAAYVRVIVREATIPLAGVTLTYFLAATDRFAVWQLPLLAGMMLVPLVRLGSPPEEQEAERRDADRNGGTS